VAGSPISCERTKKRCEFRSEEKLRKKTKKTHLRDEGKKHSVLLRALLLKHLTQAPKRRARRLPDNNLRVLKTTLNKGPHRVEVRLDVKRATLNDDTESGNGRFAKSGVGRGGESADLLEEGREDLVGREGGSEDVNDAEGGAGGCVVFDVDGFRLGTDREEGGDDRTGKVEGLNLALLELDEPEEGVESHDAEVVVVGLVGGGGEEELDQVDEVGGNEGNLRENDALEELEDGLDGRLVTSLKRLLEDGNDTRDETLERSLWKNGS
jgi:hypothetical protein